MIKKYILLILLWYVPVLVPAQEAAFNVYNYTTDDGLPTNTYEFVYKDSYGFLWLASFDGLFRWDGYTFKKYHSEEKIVYTIFEDSKKQLWVGTMGGLNLYHRQVDTFERRIRSIPVNRILEDSTQRLWLATSRGLCNYSDSVWYKSGEDVVFDMTIDRKGQIWLGTFNTGLKKFDPATKQFASVQEAGQHVTCLVTDANNHVWVGTSDKGLLEFDGKLIKRYPSPHVVTCLYEDGNKTLWVGFNRDVLHYLHGSSLVPVANGEKLVSISSIGEDDFGNIWFASEGNGLFNTNHYKNQFRYYPQQNVNCFFEYKPGEIWVGTNGNGIVSKDLLRGDAITGMARDGNKVWIATWGSGIKVLENGKLTSYHHITNDIKAVLVDDSLVWIGTQGEGLMIFDKRRNQFIDSFAFDLHAPAWINHLYKDRRGRLWISTYSGLFVWDGKQLQQFGHTSDSTSIGSNSVNMVVEDASGVLWVVHESGLDKFSAGKFIRMPGLPGAMKSIVADSNTLWISCNEGVLQFNNGRVKIYDVSDGLAANAYQKIVFRSSTGEIYAGGAKGFNVFNPARLQPLQLPSYFYFTDGYTDTIVLHYTQSFFTVAFAALNFYAPGKTQYSYKLEGLHDKWIDIGNERKASFMQLPAGKYNLRIRYTNAAGQWQEASKTLHIVMLPPWWQTWWFKLVVLLAITGVVFMIFYSLKQQVAARTSELVEERDQVLLQKEELEASNQEIRRQTDKILDQQQALANSVSELEKLNQTKDHFFSILAHDLKNPVFALTDMADYVRQHLQKMDRRELERYLDSMHHSSGAVYELLINLLNWSQTQSKTISSQPTNISLIDIVTENLRLLQPQFDKKHIRVHTQVEHSVYADRNMINTVVRNILSNAVKFTDIGGTVSIATLQQGSAITLTITDTGAGMTEEQLTNLFTFDKTIVTLGTSGEKGTGLGLVIAAEFVANNKGQLRVESKRGEGTTFFITLPASTSAFIADNNLPTIKGRKILIVDDNREMREYLKRLLSQSFEIFEAADGATALQLATQTPPHVIITDLLMPGINGLQFCREIKSGTATSHIPVVIVTSQAEDSMQASGYEAGAAVYLTKPVKKEILIQVILNLLQQQSSLHGETMERLLDDQPVAINKADEEFLHKLVSFIEAQPAVDARAIGKELAVSRTVLYSKIKALTGQTVHEFIKTIRLKRSLKLLLEGNLSISQVADEVGFSSHSYFDKCFTKQFGMGPREYIKKKRGG